MEELKQQSHAERKGHRSHPSRDSRDSLEVRPAANGANVHTNGVTTSSNNAPRSQDNVEVQRADINRIDTAVAYLQNEMAQIKGTLAELRHEIRVQDARRSSGGGGGDTLDQLSDTVSRIASRTGEVDGLRFELTALKTKLKRMEEASGIPGTPAQPGASFPRPETSAPMQRAPSQPAQQQPAPQHQHQELSHRWNAVNTTKRKSFDAESHNYVDPSKRPRSGYRATSGDSTATFGQPHIQPQPQPAPPPQPQSQPQPSSQSQPPSQATPQQQPGTSAPLLAPIRSNSQESWQPDSQRLPPLRGMHQSGRGRPPRLAQHPPQDVATPAWERDSWNAEERVGADGYYRPLGSGQEAPLSPGAAKRGSMVRRGTAGGPLQYIDPTPAKRTRQRPVRNEHGILIRKDGKPDQRSISSPQNLRKVHERRIAEQERGSQGSPQSPSSPADTEAAQQAWGSDERESFASSTKSETPPTSRPASRPQSKHDKVMNKMFPTGLADTSERMNHAQRVFEAGNPQQEVRTRERMVKEDFHDAASRIEDDEMEVDETSTTAVNAGPSSGSVYEPSRPRTQEEPESSKEAVPDSMERSAASLTDSDRPLRPRHRDIERTQEASGSLYQPSPSVEASTA